MTEDDTFNRLKRVPFRELFISILDPVTPGDFIIPKNRYPRIIEAGWTIEEFEEIVSEELSKGNVVGSVTLVTSQDWRDEFLKLEPIY